MNFRIVLLFFLALSAPAEQAPLRRSLHMTFLNPGSGDRFQQLLLSRKHAGLDLAAIGRMQREKQGELQALNQALRKQYGLDPQINYRLEVGTRTLYQVQSAETDLNAPGARKLRTFADDAAMQDLLTRLTRRKFIEMTATALNLLEAEKQQKLQALLGQLEQRYGLLPDQSYLYSAASNAVFKIERSVP